MDILQMTYEFFFCTGHNIDFANDLLNTWISKSYLYFPESFQNGLSSAHIIVYAFMDILKVK